MPLTTPRDYAPLLASLKPAATDAATMQLVVDALWQSFHSRAYSWCGFYLLDPAKPTDLLLGPRRDKPACSPIGLHGCCGRAFLSRRPLVVNDVKVMGEHYIACDPRDVSEVVVPCLNPDGSCWGVLDIDSYDQAAFHIHDALRLSELLAATGLSAHATTNADDVEVL